MEDGSKMITVSKKIKCSDGTTITNHSSLIGLEIDDTTLTQLLEMARRHCKLVLEHGRAQTSAERRREIREEIETLRSEREACNRQVLMNIFC